VQAVLDLECDRLDRTAATLAALGIERAANLLTAAAAVLRFELEGGGVLTTELLPMIRAHHDQIKRVQEAQARNLQAALDMPPDRRERYMADLEALEARHERERREAEGEDGQQS